MSNDFLDQRGDYHSLKAFKKAECIYDITFYFVHKYLKIEDRTIDQMIQAARSGKQNLAEGYIDGVTSTEMKLKLINVDRASLHELLLDYEDYLRVHNLQQWSFDDPRCRQTRAFCCTHLDSAAYRYAHPSGRYPPERLHRMAEAAIPCQRWLQGADVPSKNTI